MDIASKWKVPWWILTVYPIKHFLLSLFYVLVSVQTRPIRVTTDWPGISNSTSRKVKIRNSVSWVYSRLKNRAFLSPNFCSIFHCGWASAGGYVGSSTKGNACYRATGGMWVSLLKVKTRCCKRGRKELQGQNYLSSAAIAFSAFIQGGQTHEDVVHQHPPKRFSRSPFHSSSPTLLSALCSRQSIDAILRTHSWRIFRVCILL